MKSGRLDNTVDKNFRAINDNWPTVGFARNITVGATQSADIYFGIAHVRRPAISYTEGTYNQLWEAYFKGDDNQMVNWFFDDRFDALKRAKALDAKVVGDAQKIGGQSYVNIVSAALRQVSNLSIEQNIF